MQRSVEEHSQRSAAAVSASLLAPGLRLSVLGRFSLIDGRGEPIPVATGTQRLLSLLALRDRVVHRASVAGALWPDVSESHSHASLRSALLRIPLAARSVVWVSDAELALAEDVDVDVRAARRLAHRLLDVDGPPGAATDDEPPIHEPPIHEAPMREPLGRESIAVLSADLLPGWHDEWVVPEAEEWRQLRLHALESLTDRLVAESRFGDATAAAMAAVRAEPLRESAHAALIRVHLAEHNQSEALRQFERYEALLRAELGIEPTARLRELVGI